MDSTYFLSSKLTIPNAYLKSNQNAAKGYVLAQEKGGVESNYCYGSEVSLAMEAMLNLKVFVLFLCHAEEFMKQDAAYREAVLQPYSCTCCRSRCSWLTTGGSLLVLMAVIGMTTYGEHQQKTCSNSSVTTEAVVAAVKELTA